MLALLLVGQFPPAGQLGAASLPAWQMAAICHAGGDGTPAPAVPADRHHDHCSLCVAATGPMLPTYAAALPLPVGLVQVEAPAPMRPGPQLFTHRAYASRAPPRMV